MSSYAELLALPSMKLAVAGRIVSRLAGPMIPLAFLLHLTPIFGVALASTIFAVYSICQAAGHVQLSRWVDAKGQTLVIGLGSLLSACALFGVFLGGLWHSVPLALACAGVCGFTDPPVATGIRSVWDQVAPRELQAASAALESLITEILYVLGPLLVAVLVSFGFSSGALFVAAGALLIGGGLYCASSAVRHSHVSVEHQAFALRRHKHLWVPLAVVFLWCSTYGAGTVSLPFLWQQAGQSSNSGIVFAAISVGAILGGFCYGVRVAEAFTPKKFALALAGYALIYGAFAVPGAYLPGAIVVALTAGAINAVTFTGVYVWCGQLAPANAKASIYGYVFAAMSAGMGLGAIVAGSLLDHAGFTTALLCMTLPCFVGALMTYRTATRPKST